MEYRKNDVVSVQITDIGTDGEGIGKVDGYTLFVKDALVGDLVKAHIVKAKSNYGYARVEKVETPSPFRAVPRCGLHQKCGGCQIQALDYGKQLEYKQQKVMGNLVRIGGFSKELLEEVTEPIMGMQEPWRYRNKAQYPVGTGKDGEPIAGFYAGRTHAIIPGTDCVLGPECNHKILEEILDYMGDHHIPAYDESTGKGLVRHVLIRQGYATGEVMVCIVINGKTLPKQKELAERLTRLELQDWKITSISFSSNTRQTNVIMGDSYEVIYGEDHITDRIGAISFRISPLSFFQVNPIQTEKLYKKALEYAALGGEETVWDLYCGTGTISLFLAQKAGRVRGVEIIPQAIENARENAKQNGITNAEFFVGKAEEVLPEYYKKEQDGAFAHPDVIVVDPPRKGCDEVCLQTMVSMKPERIVYVSCDSATLARDLKYLCQNGYELKKVCPCDMFPHTVHVETVCLLSKLSGAKNTIDVKVDMDELDVTSAETKATYEEIKAYVLEHTGLQVSNLYIAQVKRECGIIERENYNKPKSEDSRQPQCPEEKRKAIMGALKHFGMV